MSDQFIAEIRILPFDFVPKNWARCDGQLLPRNQNSALFALLTTTYGGDGENNFALPDLRGRAPLHPGQGPGLSPRDLGENGGSETVTLLESEVPAHSHSLHAAADPAELPSPTGRSLARTVEGSAYQSATSNLTDMAPLAIGPGGSSQPHNNMQPYLTLYFCIALTGIFPQHG